MTEQQLIKGCVRQEHVAQKSVFDLYSKRMMGVCLRYARNEVDAEEILIEAFCFQKALLLKIKEALVSSACTAPFGTK